MRTHRVCTPGRESIGQGVTPRCSLEPDLWPRGWAVPAFGAAAPGELCPARQLALMGRAAAAAAKCTRSVLGGQGRAEDALQQLELCTSPDPQL